MRTAVNLCLIWIIILTTGCEKKSEKISLGYVATGITGLAVEVMKDLKIPEKYNLDLEYFGFTNPSLSNNAFINGKYQINLAAGANVIALARNQGHRFQYFFPTLLNSVCVVVKKESPYSSLEDLIGKKIGWYGLQSGGGTGFYVLAKIKGLDILKDYELIDTKPPTLWPLLERGEVEAIVIFEPFVSRLLATNNYRVLVGPFYQEWEKVTGYKMEMTGLSAGEDWLYSNHESAVKMIQIWNETVQHIRNNTSEVLEKYQNYTNLVSKEEIEFGEQRIPQIYISEWNNLEKSINLMLEMLVDDNVIIEKVPKDIIYKLGE